MFLDDLYTLVVDVDNTGKMRKRAINFILVLKRRKIMPLKNLSYRNLCWLYTQQQRVKNSLHNCSIGFTQNSFASTVKETKKNKVHSIIYGIPHSGILYRYDMVKLYCIRIFYRMV
jgi:hypothetical protein